MEKIDKLSSTDIVAENIQKLKQLFPTAFSEGKVVMDELQALLGEYVEKEKEYYQMTWAGKTQAQQEANLPSSGTLRPCKEESKDWDTTQNIYIEGDNLEVLKLLQKTYNNKIKMIYIDPPYNTGKDFVYKDNYKDNLQNYLELTGQTDEEGKKLSTNTESDGRYHSNWLNMMYPRLKLARNLLTEDGVIFISIDDNEQGNLKKLCDEIFGEENFIANISVVSNPRGRQSDSNIANVHDYLIAYSKNNNKVELGGAKLSDKQKKEFSETDENGKKYRLLGLRQRGSASNRADRPDMFFPIYVNPSNQAISLDMREGWEEVLPRKSDGRDGRWMWGKEKCINDINLLEAKLIKTRNEFDIFVKDFLVRDGRERTRKFKSQWNNKRYNNQVGTQEVKRLLEGDYMSFPKSSELIEDILRFGSSKKEYIILDFFSGSSTTAHAVMQLNAEDGGNRRCISVQLPEPTDEKSAAYKASYKTIAEIGKERIRRAGEKIKEDFKDKEGIDKLDVGFRVFKLDSSNIIAWDTATESLEKQLAMFSENNADHIKNGRNQEDVLYEVLLKFGLDLTLPIQEKELAGNTVYNVGFGSLYVCLDDKIDVGVAQEIGQWHKDFEDENPTVIFSDAGFTQDQDKTNVIQMLKQFGIDNVKSI